jgi:hypothetical protein
VTGSDEGGPPDAANASEGSGDSPEYGGGARSRREGPEYGESARPRHEGPEYGETWTYESIIGALPGIHLSERAALAVQFLAFQTGVLALGWYYGLESGAVAGTVAVFLATAGSFEMLRISKLVRRADPPEAYRRLAFGSSIEVVLGVLAFIALVTYLFVVDPRSGTSLVSELLGEEPPALPAYLTLLVLWDVCYRIGTGWWASVAAFWRSTRFRFAPDRARLLARADLETMGFGLLQLLLVPFLLDHPVLLFAVVGHVVAVVTVTGLSLAVLYARTEEADPATSLSP